MKKLSLLVLPLMAVSFLTSCGGASQVIEHFVTFESNGGSHINTQRVKDGGGATDPGASTRPGYNFEGWYMTNPNPTPIEDDKYDFDTKVTDDITLYAGWTAIDITHSITFFKESTDIEPYATIDDIRDGSQVEQSDLPNVPTKEGYDFCGWCTDIAGKNVFDFEVININQDYTLYAGWKENETPIENCDITIVAYVKTSDVITLEFTEDDDYLVDWDDGTVNSEKSHTYNSNLWCTIRIYGSLTSFSCHNQSGIFALDIQNVLSLDTNSFSNCNDLRVADIYNIESNALPDFAFYNCSYLTSLTVPDSVTSFGESVFEGCSSLTNITIPNSLVSIGDSAFRKCSSLKSITIPYGVPSIGVSTFSGCVSLVSINIPYSVTSIGKLAFSDCMSLESISIPSVNFIGVGAFDGCQSITSINIPNIVTSINDTTFFNCSSLTFVNIPSSITSIGDQAFMFCRSLTSVDIPNSVTSIGVAAFYDCLSLETFNLSSCDHVITAKQNILKNCIQLSEIKVKNNLIDQYKTAENWSQYADKIVGVE